MTVQINHLLTIHAPVEQVWPVLQQPELVVEALPGVTLTSIEGEDFTGRMSVGLGPMRLNYGGTGVLRYDDAARAIHIDARGSEAKGAGNAAAAVDVTVRGGADDSTQLAVAIDMELQGKPAQFGRGILSEVVTRLASQFGKNLELQVLAEPTTAPVEVASTATGTSTSPMVAEPSGTVSSALSVAAPSVTRQLAGVALGVVAGAALAGLLGRGRARAITVVLVGTDDPAWVDLVRDLTRS